MSEPLTDGNGSVRMPSTTALPRIFFDMARRELTWNVTTRGCASQLWSRTRIRKQITITLIDLSHNGPRGQPFHSHGD